MENLFELAKIDAIIENKFILPVDEGKNKVLSLEESVRRYIKPGMSLYFGYIHSRAYGAAYEIARQFWGTKPGFELVVLGVLEYAIILIYGGLVKKVIAAFFGDAYPTPRPNRVIQRSFKEGKIEFEKWTNLTIPLRLMAGALNLPFIPTNSIMGSSLEHENEASFRVINDPFVSEGVVGTMKPLHPDIAIIHGWAADRYGNAIILAPYGEDVWGAMASRNGVLLTVEKLVSTEFIREHSHLVRIPGYLVKSVSLVPFGAHPQPMTNIGLDKSDGYGEDYQFRLEFNEATKNDALLEKWIQNWVLDCRSPRDYLRKLGYKRLLFLKGKTCEDAWQYELEEKLKGISLERRFTPDEIMVIVASRGIKKCVAEKGYKTVLAGGGIASLAAWMAVYDLKKEGYDVELLAEAGFFGYTPRPGDPYLFNFNNMHTNKMQANFINILGVIGGGNNNECLAVIGGAQIDRYGNINSTELLNDVLLVGSGGANDIGTNAKEVIVLIQQTKDRFVNQLSYITTPGNKVTKLFSTMGIYEKAYNQKEFTLVGLVPDGTPFSIGNKLEQIKNNCGWDIRISESILQSENPTDEELLTLRLLDPEKQVVR